MAATCSGNVTELAARGAQPLPAICQINSDDIRDALRQGWDDFKAVPSHAVILCLIYPVVGLLLARMAFGTSILPLLFPLAAGFALVGPFAALGLYELSYRRERGESATASDALSVLRSPSFGAMLAVGALLLAIFAAWIASAQAIYTAYFGKAAASEIPHFLQSIFTTPEGWSLIIVGCGVGLLFAIAALCISVVSFPLMLDRHASAGEAIATSLMAVRKNPVAIAQWGLVVATLLVLGSLPFFLGLAIVIPLLGHSTWHLYRKLIERSGTTSHEPPPDDRPARSAADFPASLFAGMRRK